MNPITMFLILALLVAIWWLLKKRKNGAAESSAASVARTESGDSKFHAVSIKTAGHACRAAQEMSGRRFLASAAPRLPLPECDVLECNCRFAHHDDRRSNKDRRSPFRPGGVAGSTGAYTSEQRDGVDRRKDNR